MKKKQHWISIIILFFSSAVLGQQMFQHLLALNSYPDYTWTGAGPDANWTTASNWSGNVVPGVGNTANFIGAACSTNCSPTINASISVLGINMQATYPGTITQGTGFTVTVGASGWTQAAGTFIGGNSTITMNGNFTVSGGAFTATSGLLKTFNDINFTGATFNPGSGSLVISSSVGTSRNLNFGTVSLYNLKFTAASGYDNFTLTSSGTITVNGRFDIEDAGLGGSCLLQGGTFLLKGDVVTNADSMVKIKSTSIFKISGSSNQSVTGSVTAGLSNLEILSTGGTVTFSAGFMNIGNFKYTSGTVIAPTNLTQSVPVGATASFEAGAMVLNNLEIQQNAFFDGYTLNVVGVNNMNGNYTLTRPGGIIVATMNGGQFFIKGNITSTAEILGSTSLKMNGSSSQTVSGTGFVPGLEIASTGGTVTIAGSPVFRNSFLFISGVVSAAGSTAIFQGRFATAFSLTPGAIAFDNVTFLSEAYSDGVNYNLNAGTLTVNGNLSFLQPTGGLSSQVNNGIIVVGKNLTANGTNGYSGTATVQITGSSPTSIAVATSIPSGSVTSAKSSASATLTQALSLNAAGQSLNISDGVFDLAGFNLIVNNVLTIGVNGKLICNGGTITASSYVINGQLLCPLSLGTTWTGASGDHLWTTAGNWTNNTVPGASDVALFNSACTGVNCDVTINTSISVKGVSILASYSGTITQSAGNTVTVGTKGWSQGAGAFAGGNSAISMSGIFNLSGGIFTSTSGTFSQSGNFTVGASGVYNANAGTLVFGIDAYPVIQPGTAVYNNVTFTGFWGDTNLSGATMTIAGTLIMDDGYRGLINSGTLLAQGNVNWTNNGYQGSALIKIAGNTNQTLTGVSSGSISNLEIASTGGTVNMVGILTMDGNYTYTSGTVNTGTSTLQWSTDGSIAIVPGPVIYNNLKFGGCYGTFGLGGGTMTVSGTLTFNGGCGGTVNAGTLLARGDIVWSGNGYPGSALVKVAGSANQSLTSTSPARGGNLEIASTGGVVSFFGNLTLMGNYTYTSGTVNTGTSTLQWNTDANVAIVPGPVIYNNVSFGGCYGTYGFAGSTMTINGTLTLSGGCSGSVNSGTLLAQGDVVWNSGGYTGSALIKVAGSGNQTLSGVSGANIQNLEIASTGGTVALSGTLSIYGDYTYTSGAINSGTSTLFFNRGFATQTIVPGPVSYNNVTFAGGYNTFNLSSGTFNINGDLILGCSDYNTCNLNSGTLSVLGNLNYYGNGYLGSATINMNGSTTTTLNESGYAQFLSGLMTINKTGGASVTLINDYSNTPSFPNLTIASGTLNLNGYIFNIGSTLTINSGATLKCSGGAFTDGSLVNNGTINCPGYSTYDFNWTGAGGNSNWNTAGNWQIGTVPTSTDIAVFQDTYCGANCNSTMNVDPNVRGVYTYSPYTGTITQGAGIAVTIGSRGWKQAAGTFSGGNSTITMNGPMTVSGGNFISSSGSLNLANSFLMTGSSTFTHNSGTLRFYLPYATAAAVTAGTSNYNNVNFSGLAATYNLSDTMTVLGTLTMNEDNSQPGGLNTGTVAAKGNVNFTGWGRVGTGKIQIAGSSNQTITSTSNAAIPNFQVISTGGTVTYSGVLNFRQSYTYTSGALDVTGSTLSFYMDNFNGLNPSGLTIVPGTINYNNVTLQGLAATYKITGTLNVLGTLTMSDIHNAATFASGTIAAKGDVVLNNYAYYGLGLLKIAGSGNQSITGSTNAKVPNFEIASTGGVVSLIGTINYNGNYTWTSGSVNSGTSVANFSWDGFSGMYPGGVAINPGSVVFGDVSIGGLAASYVLTGTMNVGGNLTLSDGHPAGGGLNGGTIVASKNVTYTSAGHAGNTAFTFAGASSGTLTVGGSANVTTGALTVNKTGGAILGLASNVSFGGASQDLTIIAGTLDMAGYGLSIGRNISNSGTLKRGNSPACGTLTYGGTYSGTAAVCP